MAQEYTVLKFGKNDAYCYRCKCALIPALDLYDAPSSAPSPRPFEEALRWEDVGGYHGDWDCYQQAIVLCHVCTHEVLGEWIKVKNVVDPPHAARHWNRDEKDILNRWKARQDKRALKNTLPKSEIEKQNSRIKRV